MVNKRGIGAGMPGKSFVVNRGKDGGGITLKCVVVNKEGNLAKIPGKSFVVNKVGISGGITGKCVGANKEGICAGMSAGNSFVVNIGRITGKCIVVNRGGICEGITGEQSSEQRNNWQKNAWHICFTHSRHYRLDTASLNVNGEVAMSDNNSSSSSSSRRRRRRRR